MRVVKRLSAQAGLAAAAALLAGAHTASASTCAGSTVIAANCPSGHEDKCGTYALDSSVGCDADNTRSTFVHEDGVFHLYYKSTRWYIGTTACVESTDGMRTNSDLTNPADTDEDIIWRYYDGSGWSSQPTFTIECGPACAGTIDQCGVCDGTNECVGCDGVANSGLVEDSCGVCGGDSSSCAGCDGVANSGLVEDSCGVCGGDSSSCAGCDGVANSGLVEDSCGVCDGDSSSCAGCDGVANSGLIEDACGVCGGDSSSCAGCDGVANSGLVEDACGVCDGANECLGCDGVANSGLIEDACGVCGGDSSSCVGCDGVAGSGLVEDACGVCGGDSSSCAGCDGVANSGLIVDACGVCDGDSSSCAGCDGIANSGLVEDACGVCGGDSSSCAGCDGIANSGLVEDACGVCDGDSSSCAGCDGVANSGLTIDECGVCGGDGASCAPSDPEPEADAPFVPETVPASAKFHVDSTIALVGRTADSLTAADREAIRGAIAEVSGVATEAIYLTSLSTPTPAMRRLASLAVTHVGFVITVETESLAQEVAASLADETTEAAINAEVSSQGLTGATVVAAGEEISIMDGTNGVEIEMQDAEDSTSEAAPASPGGETSSSDDDVGLGVGIAFGLTVLVAGTAMVVYRREQQRKMAADPLRRSLSRNRMDPPSTLNAVDEENPIREHPIQERSSA